MSESETFRKSHEISILPFILKTTKDQNYITDLLSKTKSLVLSSLNFNKFMKNPLSLIQENPKFPEINNNIGIVNESSTPFNKSIYYSSNAKILKENLNLKKTTNLQSTNISQNFSNSTSFFNLKTSYANNNIGNKSTYDNSSRKFSTIKINNEKEIARLSSNFTFNGHFNLKNRRILLDYQKKLSDSVINSHPKPDNIKSDIINNRKLTEIDFENEYFNKNLYVNLDFKVIMIDLLCDFEFGNRIFDFEKNIRDKYNEKSNYFNLETKKNCLNKLKNIINSIINGLNENITTELVKSFDFLDKNKLEIKISSIEIEFYSVIEDKNGDYYEKNKFEDFEKVKGKNINNNIIEEQEELEENNNINYEIYNEEEKKYDTKYIKEKKIKLLQKIKLPFSVLPVFYHSTWETFLSFLSMIINLKNKNINNQSCLNITEDKDDDFSTPKKKARKSIINSKFSKNFKSFENSYEENEDNEKKSFINDNQTYQEEDTEEKIEINFETIKNVLEKFKDFIYENENYEKDFLKTKTFDWFCGEKSYLLKLHPPKLEFYLLDNTFNVHKNISKEILIFLIQRNFINWDFFILNYLTKFKIFRKNLNDRFFKKINFDIPIPQLKYGKLNNRYQIDELILHDHKTEGITFSLDKENSEPELKNLNYLEYFFTNQQGENFYFRLNSYKLKVVYKKRTENKIKTEQKNSEEDEDNKNIEFKVYNFKFNIDQMIKFEKLKKFYDLKNYLKRMLCISNNIGKDPNTQNENVKLNLNYFEFMDEKFFRFLIKHDGIDLSYSEIEAIEEMEKLIFELNLDTPNISWVESNYIREVKIPDEILRILKNTPLNGWAREIGKQTQILMNMGGYSPNRKKSGKFMYLF